LLEDQQNNSNEENRRKLINKCKYIRSLFENEFNPCLDDVDSSYLEMSGKINVFANCESVGTTKQHGEFFLVL
jgi:hypothetical protein